MKLFDLFLYHDSVKKIANEFKIVLTKNAYELYSCKYKKCLQYCGMYCRIKFHPKHFEVKSGISS